MMIERHMSQRSASPTSLALHHSGGENMMHKITLSNNFHNTEITVLTDYDTASETWYHIQEPVFAGYPTAAQRAKYRRVKNVLCGSDDCQCGTVR